MLQTGTKNVYHTTYTKYIYRISYLKIQINTTIKNVSKKRLYALIDLFHVAQECFVWSSSAHRKEKNLFNSDTQQSIH